MNEFTNASESTKRRNPHLFGGPAPASTPKAVAVERDLHDEIRDELIRRRWYFVHSRMDCRTTTQKGVPDFLIFAPFGKVFSCEIKRKGGKLRVEQNTTKHCLLALGHKYKTAYSFQEFKDFIDEK